MASKEYVPASNLHLRKLFDCKNSFGSSLYRLFYGEETFNLKGEQAKGEKVKVIVDGNDIYVKAENNICLFFGSFDDIKKRKSLTNTFLGIFYGKIDNSHPFLKQNGDWLTRYGQLASILVFEEDMERLRYIFELVQVVERIQGRRLEFLAGAATFLVGITASTIFSLLSNPSRLTENMALCSTGEIPLLTFMEDIKLLSASFRKKTEKIIGLGEKNWSALDENDFKGAYIRRALFYAETVPFESFLMSIHQINTAVFALLILLMFALTYTRYLHSNLKWTRHMYLSKFLLVYLLLGITLVHFGVSSNLFVCFSASSPQDHRHTHPTPTDILWLLIALFVVVFLYYLALVLIVNYLDYSDWDCLKCFHQPHWQREVFNEISSFGDLFSNSRVTHVIGDYLHRKVKGRLRVLMNTVEEVDETSLGPLLKGIKKLKAPKLKVNVE